MAKANRLNKRRIDGIDQPGIYGDGNTLFLKVRDDWRRRPGQRPMGSDHPHGRQAR